MKKTPPAKSEIFASDKIKKYIKEIGFRGIYDYGDSLGEYKFYGTQILLFLIYHFSNTFYEFR